MTIALFPYAVWQAGTNQNSIPANDNSLRTEAVQRAAKGVANAAPGSPADGDVYIVGTAWGSFATNDVVLYRAGTWYGFAPFDGWLKYRTDTDTFYRYDAGWAAFSGGGGGPTFAPVSTISATSHDITAAEVGGYLRFTAATAKTCTFRPNSTHALPADGEWHIRNAGTGNLTLTPGAGVTLNAPAGGSLVVPPSGTVTVKRVASDVFDVMGVTN